LVVKLGKWAHYRGLRSGGLKNQVVFKLLCLGDNSGASVGNGKQDHVEYLGVVVYDWEFEGKVEPMAK